MAPWLFSFHCLTLLLFCAASFAADIGDRSLTAQSSTGEILRQAPSSGKRTIRSVFQAADEILVKFKISTSETEKRSIHARLRSARIKDFRVVRGLEVVKLPAGMTVEQALESYRKDPNVLYAEPNYRVEKLGTPNDPFLGTQWGLRNTGQGGGKIGADIGALNAWDLSTGSSNIVVAVIDTGIDYTHGDLAANIWSNVGDCDNDGVDGDGNGYIDDCHGIDTFNHDSDPKDDNNHGTHVAGIIGAVGNNAIGVTGVNWTVKIMPCKFLGSDGHGYLSGALECLDYVKTMKERGVNIVATNNSWGGGGFSQALYDAIEDEGREGILFIVAAGNDSFDNDAWPLFPASFHLPNIISVAASDRSDQLADFSDFGSHSVYITAPGKDILSTVNGNGYAVFSGTSMATPFVSGVAALLKAQDAARDWKAIKNLILAGGTPLDALKKTITKRRLSAYGAMTCSNSVVLSRLEPIANAIVGYIGEPIDLSALHINCGTPNGEVALTVNPGNLGVVLKDDGLGADAVAADGVYTGQWTPTAEGIYNITFPSGDAVSVRVVTQDTPGIFQPYTSIPIPQNATSSSGEAVAIGDVTGDGKNDVVMLSSDPETGSALHVFAQQPDGELLPVAKYYAGTSPTSVAIGDLNNDGKADVVVINYLSGLSVFLQDGNGNLANPVVYPASYCCKVRVADVNGDGRSDVVTMGNGVVAIFFQNAQGALDPAVTYPANGARPYGLEVSDVNNDGRKDIIVVGLEQGFYPWIAVLLQKSDGTFALPVFYYTNFQMPFIGGIAAGDVNGDGRNDVVMTFAGNTPGSFILVLLQNESGGLDPPVFYPAYDIPNAIKIADVNGDGRNDIIVSHEGWGTVTVYLQAPNGSLFPFESYFSTYGADNTDSMAVGDIDNNGLPDVVTVDHDNGTFKTGLIVFRNDPDAVRRKHTITAFVFGNGAGRIVSNPPGLDCDHSPCMADFPLGLTVTFKAVLEPGSYFGGWGWFPSAHPGCSLFTDGQDCILTIHEDMELYASFLTAHPPLKISKVGTGNGTVTSTPSGISCGSDCQETYAVGTIVKLTAVADPGSVFVQWLNSTNSCMTGNSCSVTIVGGEESYNQLTAWFDSAMKMSSPQSGEVWPIKSKRNVIWSLANSPGKGSSVRIDLSRDGGATWTPIIKKAANTGSKAWKVTGPGTNKAKIRACNTAPAFCTESYAFTIQ